MPEPTEPTPSPRFPPGLTDSEEELLRQKRGEEPCPEPEQGAESQSQMVRRASSAGAKQAVRQALAVVPAAATAAAQAAAQAGNLGLNGWAKLVTNLTAVAVVFIWFSINQRDQMTQLRELQRAQLDQAKDDRAMFRSELQMMHEDSQRKWEAIHSNQDGLARLAAAIDRNTQTVERLIEGLRKPQADQCPVELLTVPPREVTP